MPRAALTNGALEPLPRDYAGSNHDAKPAAAPSLVTVDPVRTSPPLLRHAVYCCNYSNAVEHAGQDTVTPATVPHTSHCQRPPRALSEPPRSTTTTLPSKPLLFGYRMRHDAATGARFTGTAINSMALFAIPLHM
jgi:hypothetical protein